MGTGVMVGDLMAVADVGDLWGEADERRKRKAGKRKKRRRADGRGVDGSKKDASEVDSSDAAAKLVRQEWAQWGSTAQRITAKRLGEIAEAAFLLKASGMGLGVAKPWGDSEPYDFILAVRGRLLKVQVKAAFTAGQGGCYSFCTHDHALRPYSAKDFDALVAYVAPESAWYVLPMRLVRRLRALKLFPASRRKRSKFEKYREAWWVLRGE